MLLSTHSLRVGRAFVFVLQLYRHGPERQQITFFKSGDWKGSCNSFNKYFARLICIRSHCVHQILQQYLHSSWKNISLMKQIQSQFSDFGGWGSEHRGSMKVISDGLEIIPPWLGLRYHQPKMLSPGVSWWWMAGVAYWRLLWRIQSHDGVVVVTFHILLPGSRSRVVNTSRDAIKIMIKTSPTHFVIIGSVVLPNVVLCWIIIFWE